MTDNDDRPADRPMPEHLQDALWSRIRPELTAPRRRQPGPPLAVAAVVGVLAVGAVVAFGPGHEAGPNPTAIPAGAGSLPQPAPDPADVKLVKDCVDATLGYGYAVPAPGSWRPAAKIDADTSHGFMVIRNDISAAVCVIDGDKSPGIMGADSDEMAGRRFGYAKLTAKLPFNSFTGIGGLHEPTFEFGIVTTEVAAVSVVGPDGSVFPATVRDGTFAVKINDGRGGVRTEYRARMTMKNGNVIEAPLK
ncbi:hypothetical protein OG943_31385 [Amycolatopsis sp. NBC_00345]|uniref:hypothetical protein n=1 Tax=Amycolatopsis sp. NBC_00345 TaxID=2975955 RepID=UPI002E25D174